MRKFLGFILLIFPLALQAQGTAPLAASDGVSIEAPTAAACKAPKTNTAVPPVKDGKPVEVSLGITFTDILGVSDADQNIQLDIAQVMEWNDPRLASLEGCFLSVTDVWTPRAEMLNSSRLTPKYTQARNQVEVLEGGQIRYVQRYSGTISTYHNLRLFPFDTQNFAFDLITPLYDADLVQFVPNSAQTGITDRNNIEDWKFKGFTVSVQDETLQGFENPHSVISFTLESSRKIWYYIFKMFIPLTLIVSMSWVVFWISPKNFEAQIGFGATSMLTLIAFQFSMAGNVPKLSYFTSMDYMLFGATVLVYSAILEALITGIAYRRGHEAFANRLDQICRWLFPTIFLLYWVFIILRALAFR